MKASVLGEAAAHLAWLSPGAAALVALTRPPSAEVWAEVRRDPGCVLLVLRRLAGQAAVSPPAVPSWLHRPVVLEGACLHLDEFASGFVDWNQPGAQTVYHVSLRCALAAQLLAGKLGTADPDQAWLAGLLAPLGWLAICAIDASAASACLADPAFRSQPVRIQQRAWGLDHAAIARRLARHWQLPPWVAVCAGHLDLPAETAVALGAEPALFRTVQLAVALVEEHGPGLGLSAGLDSTGLALGLGTASEDRSGGVLDLPAIASELGEAAGPAAWERPDSAPLLRDLLRLAAENRRLADSPTVEQLDVEVDRLSLALVQHRREEATRLHEQKLNALAEFAAGAGHEINNPLAVISGQAQYLLRQLRSQEAELRTSEAGAAGLDQPAVSSTLSESRTRPLQKIIEQTQRIHQILSELMLFARPSAPRKQVIDLRNLIHDALAAVRDLAERRRVLIRLPEPCPVFSIYADPRHLTTALTCLLRNAVEAASLVTESAKRNGDDAALAGANGTHSEAEPAGWARLRIEHPAPERLELCVEDSGSGPKPEQIEHLFNPFYSGRQAGRGRGLGLPTAWRLARENGGDVAFATTSGGPTCFVLRLTIEPETHPAPLTAPSTFENGCLV